MIPPNKPDVNPASRYSISQTCTILGMHRNTLRRLTSMKRIKCGVRKATNRKFYTGREITRFWYQEI
jgi:DNA-binding transcriptional MerR regulator